MTDDEDVVNDEDIQKIAKTIRSRRLQINSTSMYTGGLKPLKILTKEKCSSCVASNRVDEAFINSLNEVSQTSNQENSFPLKTTPITDEYKITHEVLINWFLYHCIVHVM